MEILALKSTLEVCGLEAPKQTMPAAVADCKQAEKAEG